MGENSTKLLNALKILLGKTEARVWVHDYEGNSVIHVEPSKPRTAHQHLNCSFWVDESDTCSVDIGQGCHFDVPEAYTVEGMKYLTSIAESAVRGSAEEVVVEKRGVIISSTLCMVVNNQVLKYNYRRGLINFGGKKKIVTYSPYD